MMELSSFLFLAFMEWKLGMGMSLRRKRDQFAGQELGPVPGQGPAAGEVVDEEVDTAVGGEEEVRDREDAGDQLVNVNVDQLHLRWDS